MAVLIVIAVIALAVLIVVSLASTEEESDARAVIGKQLELIKNGDVAALKAGFTKRCRDQITPELVKSAVDVVRKMTLDDLVGSVMLESKSRLRVRMKNSRPLTTLVFEGGEWLADSLWFK